MPVELIKFEEFELDCAGFELRRAGRVIKLEKRPLELLIFLAEKSGQLVTRQEIADRLWGKDVFLDTEHGVNTAVRKIRVALRDDFEQPRFIQTITGKGYRFVARPLIATDQVLPQQEATTRAALPSPEQVAISTETHKNLRINHSRKATLALACCLVVILALVSYFLWRRTRVSQGFTSRQVMLAVLPFQNLSGDPNEDYFSDGLTEEMITQLGALSPDRLGVIARTTSMAYKQTSKSVHQIGEELGVDYVLESSVRRDGDQLRVSAQLIRTRDQVYIWAQSYDRQVSHSIALQEELAKAVAEQIEVNLSPSYAHRTGRRIDPAASEAYLRGRYFSNQFTADGYRKAITYFQQAIDLDPNFAEAYSGLADSYIFLVITDNLSPADGAAKALDSARRAVSLGEDVAESHNSLANVMMNFQWNWSGAEPEFKRAIELNPSYSNQHRIYAAFLVAVGRRAEAWEQINQAMHTDPLSLPNNAEVVRTLYYAREYDQAIQQAQKALQLDPSYYRVHFWLARVYAQKKMYDEAIAESSKVLKALPDSNLGLTELAYSLAAAGRKNEARNILHRLEERSKNAFVPDYDLAVIHLVLGEKDAALNSLQKAYQARDWAMFVLNVEPRLDPLRGDPRFEAMVQQLNFPRLNSRR